MNKAAKDVRKLAKEKGFPYQMKDMDFLLRSIGDELEEAKIEHGRLNYTRLHGKLIDVLILVLQAIGVIDMDIDAAFKKKMAENFKRDWK